MSTLKVSEILDTDGGNTVTINGATPTTYNTMGRNRIINGDMRIDQRNAGTAVTGISGTDNYVPDRFQIRVEGGGVGRCSAQQVTDAPTSFTNSLKITVTTTDASPVSGYGYAVRQAIEAYNTSDMNFGTANAKTFTLSFWVKSSVTGSFGLTFGNNANDRWYGALYTISSANTWEYKTVTVAGDTTGTWEGASNNRGLIVNFGLGGGGYRVIDTGWQTAGTAGNKTAVTGGVNLFATSGATFQVSGVQLEVGSVATEFERRPYELALCQRYYWKISGSSSYPRVAIGPATSSTGHNSHTDFPTTMRATPTLSTSGNLGVWAGATIYSVTSISLDSNTNTNTGVLSAVVASGLTTSNFYTLIGNNDSTSSVAFSAEL